MTQDGTQRPPSAGDSSEDFAGLSLPSCDEDGCGDDPEYLTKDGAFCDSHAWTHGVDRYRAGRSVHPGTDDEDLPEFEGMVTDGAAGNDSKRQPGGEDGAE